MSGQSINGMACPVCKTGLALAERQGIEIDYCPSCRGVWLDRNELDKIVERSAIAPTRQEVVPQNRSYEQYDGDRRHHGHPKRRKSFLEELFD